MLGSNKAHSLSITALSELMDGGVDAALSDQHTQVLAPWILTQLLTHGR